MAKFVRAFQHLPLADHRRMCWIQHGLRQAGFQRPFSQPRQAQGPYLPTTPSVTCKTQFSEKRHVSPKVAKRERGDKTHPTLCVSFARSNGTIPLTTGRGCSPRSMRRRWPAIMRGLLRKASMVLPARWGVTVALSSARSGWSGGNGSTSKTFQAVPMIRRSASASQSGFVHQSTSGRVHQDGSRFHECQLGGAIRW